MSDFIVLGFIPGTNIQIGLVGWLLIFTSFIAVLYVIRRERRFRTFRFLLIRLSLGISQFRQHRI